MTGHLHTGEVKILALAADEIGLAAALCQLGQRMGQRFGIHAAMEQFCGDLRRYAIQTIHDIIGFPDTFQQIGQSRFIQPIDRRLFASGGHTVHQTGQYGTVGHFIVDLLDAAQNDALFIEKQQIGALADQLADQLLFGNTAQFIGGGKCHHQQALALGLGDRQDLAALHVLAQQHTEHGRCGGILGTQGGQINTGIAAAAGDHQADIAAEAAEGQNDLGGTGHEDLIDAGIFQLAVQLQALSPEEKTVYRHASLSFSSSSIRRSSSLPLPSN